VFGRYVKSLRSSPYTRPLAVIASISAAIIVRNLIRPGSVSYGEALGIVIATVGLVCIFWVGGELLRQDGGSSER
jgi:hypothetical protein